MMLAQVMMVIEKELVTMLEEKMLVVVERVLEC